MADKKPENAPERWRTLGCETGEKYPFSVVGEGTKGTVPPGPSRCVPRYAHPCG